MAEVTIMITCLGGGLSAQFIRILKESRRHRARVIGVDMHEKPVARHFANAFEAIPAGDAANYAEIVRELCRKHGVDIVFPWADEEVLALARAKAGFDADGVTLACNTDLSLLELITNKVATYEALAKLGVPMPVWHRASHADALQEGLADVLDRCGQAVVKTPDSRGGRGIYVINPGLSTIEPRPGSQELHMNSGDFLAGPARSLKWDTSVLIMERLVDPVHDLDILAWEGEVKTAIPRRRHSSSAPNEGHVIVDAPELVSLGKKIVSALRMSWLFDIDIMMNGKGEPIVLEVNPRASGSVCVGMAAGVPLMDDLISLAIGEQVTPRDVPYGRRIYAYQALSAK